MFAKKAADGILMNRVRPEFRRSHSACPWGGFLAKAFEVVEGN